MNDDIAPIRAALDRRFARAAVPACPDGAWRAKPATNIAPQRPRPRLAYAAAALIIFAIAGLSAQASPAVRLSYAKIVERLFVSPAPLQPLVHRADRLTIAEAQRRMPFPIVVPAGLPEHTRFLYAHVVSERPAPRVALNYEAHLASRYYRISFRESTAVTGPPVAHFELRSRGGITKTWTIPLRRWKRGPVVIDLFAPELPAAMSDRIVRANAL